MYNGKLSRPQHKAMFGDKLLICSGVDSGHAEVDLSASICRKRQVYSNADLEDWVWNTPHETSS